MIDIEHITDKLKDQKIIILKRIFYSHFIDISIVFFVFFEILILKT